MTIKIKMEIKIKIKMEIKIKIKIKRRGVDQLGLSGWSGKSYWLSSSCGGEGGIPSS